MKLFAWCVLGLAVAVAGQTPEPSEMNAATEATVTFYSGGNLWKTGLPSVKTGVFQGCIFDNEKMLICLRWREYAVVTIAPGMHIFSASLSTKRAAANSQTPLLLEASKSYYLRAENEHAKFDTIPIPVGTGSAVSGTLHPNKGRLDVVSCEVAQTETMDSAPVGTHIAGKDWKRRPRDGAPQCAANAVVKNP